MRLASVAFVAARVGAALVFFLTWVYGATALSPFAFDMFVKPRLFPWLETFVNWHHLWYFGAFLLSAATLSPVLSRGWRGQPTKVRAAWWASAAYVSVIGVTAAYLVNAPRLPMLTSGARDLLIVPGALLPLLWLAVIDHLAAWPTTSDRAHAPVTGQRRLLAACLGAALLLWVANLIRVAKSPGVDINPLVSVMAHGWALAIGAAAFVTVYLLLSLIAAIAATTRRPFAAEYGLVVLLLAAGAVEFFRRVVFPPLMFSVSDAAVTAAPLGIVAALMFAGLRVQMAQGARPADTALDLLLAFHGHRLVGVGLLLAVATAAGLAAGLVAQIDWATILQRLIAVIESLLMFGLLLGWARSLQGRDWSFYRLSIPVIGVLAAIHAAPLVARAAVDRTGQGRLDPQQMLDRYQSTNPLASLVARAVVEQAGSDPGFYRDLLQAEARLSSLVPTAPPLGFSDLSGPPPAAIPHVFVFVIDSLRRDYLSPYNEAVTFTPSIDRWARDQFVFRNAFTAYGGTWLAMPSIWTGSAVTRRWQSNFADANALEQLIVRTGYDFVINDFTIEEALRPETTRTFLDPSIPSVDTDLCQNISSLQAHFDGRSSQAPVFAYLAPMNVHILNTRSGGRESDQGYEGFYAPYASRLERLDGCFGRFIAFLKDRGLYDDSVVILTSDHGDSLGTDGRWGHQFYLFPEDIRIPLIVQLPASIRSRPTADLGRIAFLSDIAPTLYRVIGHHVREMGTHFGAPLFVSSSEEPLPRRRESFVVMSSYGSTYGLLRRNGRALYIADLVNRREHALALSRGLLGRPSALGDVTRQLNQRVLLERLADIGPPYTDR